MDDIDEVIVALNSVQESLLLLQQKGGVEQQPRFVKEQANELSKIRKISLDRFIQTLKK